MEIKNSFLSRWFGTTAKNDETEAGHEAQDAPEEVSQQPSGTEEAPSMDADPRHIVPVESVQNVSELWRLCRKQFDWLPSPMLCMEGRGDALMPEDEAKSEMFRLQITANTSAKERLKELTPKKPAEDGIQEGPPDLDAAVTVFTAKNGLTSWLFIYPPSGAGKELDGTLLRAALEKAKVCFGIDEALLEELPQDPWRYFRLIPFARGIPAVDGRNGEIVDLFPRAWDRSPVVDEHGTVDYMNLDFVHNVEQGDTICKIILPTDGTPGRTVYGQEIPAKDGKAATVPKGRNTEVSEDGCALVAKISGHVDFSGRSFQVKPVLDIQGNVDYSVGNINFWGDVNIRGDICSGFTVRATGSITVSGIAEACTIEAGRDLVVSGGIQGDNHGIIRAQQSIYAKYIENSCVYAKTSLDTECIINCEVYCGDTVTVRSGHQSIIGGKVHAAHEINAGTVGTRAEIKTKLILGGNPCEEFDFDMLQKEVKELEEELARTELQPESEDKTARISKLRIQSVVSKGKLNMLQSERELLEDEEEDDGVRHLVCDTIYPGTVLAIEDAIYRFQYKTSACTAALIDGEIRVF